MRHIARVVDSGDEDLPRGEFEQLSPAAVAVRRNQASGNEDDPPACRSRCPGDAVVVTDGTVPKVPNLNLIEHFAAQGRRAAPGKVPIVIAQHGYDGSVPNGPQQRGQPERRQRIPSISRTYGNFGFVQRRHQVANPMSRVTRIGVAKDENLSALRRMIDGVTQVVNLLAAIDGGSGNQDGGAELRSSRQAGSSFGVDDEECFKGRIVLIANRRDVLAKLGVDALCTGKTPQLGDREGLRAETYGCVLQNGCPRELTIP